MNLLDIHEDDIVAIAKIILLLDSEQLHNKMHPEGFYKVVVDKIIVAESFLMVSNKDNNLEQLIV